MKQPLFLVLKVRNMSFRNFGDVSGLTPKVDVDGHTSIMLNMFSLRVLPDHCPFAILSAS